MVIYNLHPHLNQRNQINEILSSRDAKHTAPKRKLDETGCTKLNDGRVEISIRATIIMNGTIKEKKIDFYFSLMYSDLEIEQVELSVGRAWAVH